MKIPKEKKIDICKQALHLRERFSVYRRVDDVSTMINSKSHCYYVPYLIAYGDGSYFAPILMLTTLTLKSVSNTVDLTYSRFGYVDNIEVFFLCTERNIFIIPIDIEEFCGED